MGPSLSLLVSAGKLPTSHSFALPRLIQSPHEGMYHRGADAASHNSQPSFKHHGQYLPPFTLAVKFSARPIGIFDIVSIRAFRAVFLSGFARAVPVPSAVGAPEVFVGLARQWPVSGLALSYRPGLSEDIQLLPHVDHEQNLATKPNQPYLTYALTPRRVHKYPAG